MPRSSLGKTTTPPFDPLDYAEWVVRRAGVLVARNAAFQSVCDVVVMMECGRIDSPRGPASRRSKAQRATSFAIWHLSILQRLIISVLELDILKHRRRTLCRCVRHCVCPTVLREMYAQDHEPHLSCVPEAPFLAVITPKRIEHPTTLLSKRRSSTRR